MLQETFIERANRRGLVGNIYKGCVCRVLPGMQAAFVDIGLDRAAFLHASDIVGASKDPADEKTPDPADTQHIARPDKQPFSAHQARAVKNIHRAGARWPGSARSGHQGSPGHQGRAFDDPHLHPLLLSGLHAGCRHHRRLAAHRGGGGAHAPAGSGGRSHAPAHRRQSERRRSGERLRADGPVERRRLHRSHRRRVRQRGADARRHGFSRQALGLGEATHPRGEGAGRGARGIYPWSSALCASSPAPRSSAPGWTPGKP